MGARVGSKINISSAWQLSAYADVAGGLQYTFIARNGNR